MLRQVISMMGQITNNSAGLSQIETDMSTTFQQLQKKISDAEEANYQEQKAEAAKQGIWNLIMKIFGYVIMAAVMIPMVATGNFVGAAACVALTIAIETGGINKLIDCCIGSNANPLIKLGITIAVVVALSLLTGSISGIADGAIGGALESSADTTLSTTLRAVLSKSTAVQVLKYFAMEGAQVLMSTNVANDLGSAIASIKGLNNNKTLQAVLSGITEIVLMLMTMVTATLTANGAAGEQILARLKSWAETSKIGARLQQLIDNLPNMLKILTYSRAGMQVASVVPGIGYNVSIIRQGKMQKELGPLAAAQQIVAYLLDSLNQMTKQRNEDLKKQLEIFTQGNERLVGITQPIAYAASLLV